MKEQEVSGLRIFEEKGKPGIEKDAVKVLKGGGIEGDRHCFDKDRQISIMTRNAYEWMQAQEVEGLCFRRFKANIVIDTKGGSIPGPRLKAGGAVLAVEGKKRCFKECGRYREHMDCMLKDSCWYASAVSDGEIHIGDKVQCDYNWNRYERQMMVPSIGRKEQESFCNSSVLVIGAGGLGCPVLTALSEAGVGRIGIMDGDVVEETNLNRQFLYSPADFGKNKAECAGRWVNTFRPDCQTDIYPEWFTEENGSSIINNYDLVIAAVDRISTRLLINRTAVSSGKPLIDGAVDGFYGTVTAILGNECPCLACINPEGKEPSRTSSSLGTTTMVVGALEAQFALQYLAGIPIKGGTVLSYDGVYGTLEELPVKKNPECMVCRNVYNCQKNNEK